MPVGAVLETNFYRSRATTDLERLPGPVVEVFCRCDQEITRASADRPHCRASAGGAHVARTPGA
ncbi:MAG: hypothetical protein ACRD0L_05360 [Acidimicrobiales bacterium]